ncbi:uncharacterized protein (TIGR00369 family) [Pacificibacter maritimus]|uniref:Uncharacterized protein (TIGR00369 family) n=1 Tax=Pacificibacter maritimus TaxID=762213 RepID=A0A3N4URX2_9RHOB|nr:PaaI family thioesterase [Pacificibacter maritimus]RPE71425.1 uncharacterized protein (TIGR00369 family) [Pacificibacter maritimus]
MAILMDRAALEDHLRGDFGPLGDALQIETVTPEAVTLRLTPRATEIRHGGTVSGPALFLLADVAFYMAVLAKAGPKKMSVTVSASIDYLRRPAGDLPVLGEARVHKLGRSLAMGQVLMRNPDSDDVLAQAQLTFALPPS